MIKYITSRDNKTIKTVRSLHRKKDREKLGLYLAEGVRIVNDAIRYTENSVKYILASSSYAEQNDNFIKKLDSDEKIVYITEDKIFNDLCDTETPQGILAVLEIPKKIVPKPSALRYALILDGISEPGNMGTIIRTAEAAGIDIIYLANNCTDIYSPKVVRSSMGSVFRMDFFNIDASYIDDLKNSDFTVLATALYNSVPIEGAKPDGKRAIIIGSEAKGVSDEFLEKADISVAISMRGSIESLNAAVAAGIAMYMLRPGDI